MMPVHALFSGIGFGLIVAAPVGPISVLVMNRVLGRGFRAGLATGAGIALADGLYACIAVLGFRAVNAFFSAFAAPLRLFGCLFLGYLALRMLFSRIGETSVQDRDKSMWHNTVSGLLLTLSNPVTILSFAALAASLGSGAGRSWLLPSGIMLGSIIWWLFLSLLISWLRGKISSAFSRKLTFASSLILLLFSLYGFRNALFFL
ncbi:LysE family translocator [Paenibacillus sp. NFR01]|uniref:LysE family translocator n=1 Tax=Paenibacillus sp. NFR01 TaxID=1566279 RepID=UPI0008BE4240|nr:LysE family transporter [Paenibacillus sp. NFR01]SES97637.1 Threonine/homoserine/homoserine lactone efflux protein [Paenibacillus sp. NFR01]